MTMITIFMFFLMSGTLLSHLHPSLTLTQSYTALTITVIALLQAGKRRLREVKSLAQDHTVSMRQSQDLNSGLLNPGVHVHCIAWDRKNMQKEKTGRKEGNCGSGVLIKAVCCRILELEASKEKSCLSTTEAFFFLEPNHWLTEFTCLYIIIGLGTEQLWPCLKSILTYPRDSFKLPYKQHSVFVK